MIHTVVKYIIRLFYLAVATNRRTRMIHKVMVVNYTIRLFYLE